jgi:hypothetical protein
VAVIEDTNGYGSSYGNGQLFYVGSQFLYDATPYSFTLDPSTDLGLDSGYDGEIDLLFVLWVDSFADVCIFPVHVFYTN